MTIDRAKIMEWLGDDDGDDWSLRRERVAKSDWDDRAWRAEYLAKRAGGRGYHHVHDEDEGSQVRVWFVVRRV